MLWDLRAPQSTGGLGTPYAASGAPPRPHGAMVTTLGWGGGGQLLSGGMDKTVKVWDVR